MGSLEDLVTERLIQLSLVPIERRKPASYMLCVKGGYDLHQIQVFVEEFILALMSQQKGIFVFSSRKGEKEITVS